MTLQAWQDWLETFVLELSQDFGVSDFFSSPDTAAAWVQEYVIDPNPRLSPQEKDILTHSSNEARIYANQECTGNPSPENLRDCAHLYWVLMGEYIAENTNDAKLHNLFDVAIDAAESATLAGQKKNLPKNKIKLPWWLLLFPLAFLLRR